MADMPLAQWVEIRIHTSIRLNMFLLKSWRFKAHTLLRLPRSRQTWIAVIVHIMSQVDKEIDELIVNAMVSQQCKEQVYKTV